MDRNARTLKLVKAWAKRIGVREATDRLYNNLKLGFSTSTQMARGVYKSRPNDSTVASLLEEMAKDGISLADEIAS